MPGTSQLNTRRRAGSARLERRSAARFVASPCAPAAMSGLADTDINTMMRGADDAVIAIWGVFYLLIGAFNVQSTMQSRRHPLGAACRPVLAVHVHVGVTVGLAGYRLWKYTIFVLGFIIVGTVAVLAIKLPFSPLHDDGDATDALIVWVIAGLM